MRGQKPKPIAMQMAEGDTKKVGARKLSEQRAKEPKSAPILPGVPANLSDSEKADYLTIKQAVEDLGLADHADGKCLELAAIAISEARRNKSGQALRTALAYLSSLGLGGATSRARLALEPAKNPADELREILSRPRERKAPMTQ